MISSNTSSSSSFRSVLVASYLQLKVRKKSNSYAASIISAAIRRKKWIYEEAEWVVLCVHDDRVPHLEWYSSNESVASHRPTKLIDLLDASYVINVINDERCFAIGFNDPHRSHLELAALTQSDRQEWVQKLSTNLKQLKCLDPGVNLYAPIPIRYPIIDDDAMHSPLLDSVVPLMSDRMRVDDEAPNILAPMPPTDATIVDYSSSSYEHITHGMQLNHHLSNNDLSSQIADDCELDDEEIVDDDKHIVDHRRPPLPPRQCDSIRASTLSSLMTPTRNEYNNHYDVPRASSSTNSSPLYDYPSPRLVDTSTNFPLPPISEHPIDDDVIPLYENCTASLDHASVTIDNECAPSTTCRVPDAIDNIRLSTVIPPPLSISQSPTISDGYSFSLPRKSNEKLLPATTIKRIQISMTLGECVEDIALIEVGGRLWIAGWCPRLSQRVSSMLHIGDHVVRIGGVDVTSQEQIPSVFYSVAVPGAPIAFEIHSLPEARTYSLQRNEANLGIVLEKCKNKIAAIDVGSAAQRAGINANVPSFFDRQRYSAAVITQVNGWSTNLFAKNNTELERRLTNGTDVLLTIVVHPYDFIKAIKRQMKLRMKNYKYYVPIDNS